MCQFMPVGTGGPAVAFDTKAVTNYILDRAEASGIEVSPMKLLKLLYYSHGWHLALTNEPLLNEYIEAWQYGPVVTSVYHDFKQFGNNPIKKYRMLSAKPKLIGGGLKIVKPELDGDDQASKNARAVIDRVIELYGDYTAIQLSNMTHTPGSPWSVTWESMGEQKRMGKDIDDDLIKEHFRKQIKRK